MSIISAVVEQHVEESSFLWLLRDSAVHEPHYSLSDLAHLDNRIDAHIDGLRIAGDQGWALCKEALAWEEAGEVFTASILAFENSAEERVQAVLDAGIIPPELSRGLVSALGWLDYQQAEDHIQELLNSESSDFRRIGLAASAVRRQDPGRPLLDALVKTDPLLRVRALKAVGELGRRDLLPLLKEHLNSQDDDSRFYAAWSAALLGDTASVGVLCEIALSIGPRAERATNTALRQMNLSEAQAWLRGLPDDPGYQRLAVIGAGVIGDPVLIPWLIQMMEDPELARVAGESFTMITGIDIAYEDLEGECPEGFEAEPTESPEDEDVELDSDEDLSWPEPGLISDWWTKNKGQFRDGTRYLIGQPISAEHCQQVLRSGFQRQRTAAALELAMLDPGQPLFEVRAPGFRQQQILGLK
jgi:uncharacterized protein (TIGR02270 family)